MTFSFCLQEINCPDQIVHESFSRLAPDRWMPEDKGSRTRRLSRVKTSESMELTWINNGEFYQSPKVNKVNGGIQRKYQPLEEEVANSKWLQTLIWQMSTILELSLGTLFEIHQFRVPCSPYTFGYPAPEGRHQDGRRYVAIVHIHQENITGAVTQLFKSGDREERPFLELSLQPGNLLVFNDERYFHFTTPFQAASRDGCGFRDVFILTVPNLD
ncbi:2OG-Fe dioxygenase family protein [Ancylothrix sp. C2]|uniref:2OG-Fe dioxygenase family protein n=1 Tax=Ancylothrix sp. D3o TaxID=2953691 RepID=UPI0021BB8223|nr:2OG-Fe dioxygenase family protein [Ancylothrix sp. D3o]MCT7953001.1 2OG-Fe dioxygenase family protein [Ancylothrix sp. D3o]